MGAFWTPLDGGIRPLVFFSEELIFYFYFVGLTLMGLVTGNSSSAGHWISQSYITYYVAFYFGTKFES
jgi:hypothetical protein